VDMYGFMVGKIIILKERKPVKHLTRVLPSGKLLYVVRRDNTMTSLLGRTTL